MFQRACAKGQLDADPHDILDGLAVVLMFVRYQTHIQAGEIEIAFLSDFFDADARVDHDPAGAVLDDVAIAFGAGGQYFDVEHSNPSLTWLASYMFFQIYPVCMDKIRH